MSPGVTPRQTPFESGSALPSLVACKRYSEPLWLMATAFWPYSRVLLSTTQHGAISSGRGTGPVLAGATEERKNAAVVRVAWHVCVPEAV